MGRRHDLEKSLLAERRQRLAIVAEHGLERRLRPPVRVPRRQRLDPVDREHDLEIHRLLGPQRAVIIERGDARLDRDEVCAARRGHARHEIGDRFLHRAVVPGGQGVCRLRPRRAGGPAGQAGDDQRRGECQCYARRSLDERAP
jgi:hypothetical protein